MPVFPEGEVKFLGHVVSGQGMSADPDKVQRAREFARTWGAPLLGGFSLLDPTPFDI